MSTEVEQFDAEKATYIRKQVAAEEMQFGCRTSSKGRRGNNAMRRRNGASLPTQTDTLLTTRYQVKGQPKNAVHDNSSVSSNQLFLTLNIVEARQFPGPYISRGRNGLKPRDKKQVAIVGYGVHLVTSTNSGSIEHHSDA